MIRSTAIGAWLPPRLPASFGTACGFGHWSVHADAIFGRAQHGADDAIVCAAAAQVAVERGADLGFGRVRLLLQKCRSGHHDAGDAVAALHRLLGDEGFLQGMRWRIGAQPPSTVMTDLPGTGPQRRIAGRHGEAIDDDVAGSALIAATAQMRGGEAKLAQDEQQRGVGSAASTERSAPLTTKADDRACLRIS